MNFLQQNHKTLIWDYLKKQVFVSIVQIDTKSIVQIDTKSIVQIDTKYLKFSSLISLTSKFKEIHFLFIPLVLNFLETNVCPNFFGEFCSIFILIDFCSAFISTYLTIQFTLDYEVTNLKKLQVQEHQLSVALRFIMLFEQEIFSSEVQA